MNVLQKWKFLKIKIFAGRENLLFFSEKSQHLLQFQVVTTEIPTQVNTNSIKNVLV